MVIFQDKDGALMYCIVLAFMAFWVGMEALELCVNIAKRSDTVVGS
jgi:hypothetical protein